MKEAGEQFSYTAKRSEYLSLVVAFVMLIILEAVGFDLLIAILVEGWLKFVLLGIVVCLHIFILVMFVAPLFTKHGLTPTHLRLHYSYQFRADLPRSTLVAAEPVKEKLDSPMVVKPFYHKDSLRLKLPFSGEGQVLLYLARPVSLRIGLFKKVEVRQMLLNVDRREAFLIALALPLKPDSSTEESLKTLPV
jgi:hypothetical protein